MADNPEVLSRRKWLGLISPPALAALGAGLLSQESRGAEAAPGLATSDLGARIYNIRDFGAKGDGTTLDTAALQAALDACNGDGGGMVLVPKGTFLIGSTELKSNTTLHLAASAKLLGSGEGKHYHAVEAIPLQGDTTLEDGNWALLFATNAKNVTIEGPGTIDGQGHFFHPPTRGAAQPSGLRNLERPYHILCYRCENLTVRSLDLIDCAYHSIRVIQSKYVRMEGLHIYNRVTGNNDGFHFISAEHVMVSNCTVQSQDDACALFGSCKFITITNSTFSTRWSVFRFGGGIAENITVSNCILYQVFGCPIKMQARPGDRFENMSFSNLVFDEVTGPISISAGSGRRRRPESATSSTPPATNRPAPIVRNISFSNIHGTVTTNPPPLPGYPYAGGYNIGEKHSAIVLNAVLGAVIENVTLDNVHLTFGGGGTAEEGANRSVPEISGEYFALGAIPAYGLYARNARALTLNNVRFQVSSPELRPAVVLDHVEDVSFNAFSVEGNSGAESVLRFMNSKQALLTATRLLTPAPLFLQVEGAASEAIAIDGGDLSRATTATACKAGAPESAIRQRV